MKNPLTLAGIEPATFRFVAQHLKHCATMIPVVHIKNNDNKNIHFNLGQFTAIHLTIPCTSLTKLPINRKSHFIFFTKNGNKLQQSTCTLSTTILCYFTDTQWPWCSFVVDNKPIIAKPVILQREHSLLYITECSPRGSEKYSYCKLWGRLRWHGG